MVEERVTQAEKNLRSTYEEEFSNREIYIPGPSEQYVNHQGFVIPSTVDSSRGDRFLLAGNSSLTPSDSDISCSASNPNAFRLEVGGAGDILDSSGDTRGGSVDVSNAGASGSEVNNSPQPSASSHTATETKETSTKSKGKAKAKPKVKPKAKPKPLAEAKGDMSEEEAEEQMSDDNAKEPLVGKASGSKGAQSELT